MDCDIDVISNRGSCVYWECSQHYVFNYALIALSTLWSMNVCNYQYFMKTSTHLTGSSVVRLFQIENRGFTMWRSKSWKTVIIWGERRLPGFDLMGVKHTKPVGSHGKLKNTNQKHFWPFQVIGWFKISTSSSRSRMHGSTKLYHLTETYNFCTFFDAEPKFSRRVYLARQSFEIFEPKNTVFGDIWGYVVRTENFFAHFYLRHRWGLPSTSWIYFCLFIFDSFSRHIPILIYSDLLYRKILISGISYGYAPDHTRHLST